MESNYAGNVMTDAGGYFSIQEIKKILNVAKANSHRDYILLLTLYKSGRRVSEVVGALRRDCPDKEPLPGLRRMDIDWDSHQITWYLLKKSQTTRRSITMPDDLFPPLHRYIVEKNQMAMGEPVFKITRQRVFQIVRKLCEEVGIERLGEQRPHPHHFRHSFAVHFVKSGNDTIEDLRWLKRFLGHSNIENTMTYLQFSIDDKEKLKSMPSLEEIEEVDTND